MQTTHVSECAVHNGPAYEAGPCDCGAIKAEREPRPSSPNRFDDIQDGDQENARRAS